MFARQYSLRSKIIVRLWSIHSDFRTAALDLVFETRSSVKINEHHSINIESFLLKFGSLESAKSPLLPTMRTHKGNKGIIFKISNQENTTQNPLIFDGVPLRHDISNSSVHNIQAKRGHTVDVVRALCCAMGVSKHIYLSSNRYKRRH